MRDRTLSLSQATVLYFRPPQIPVSQAQLDATRLLRVPVCLSDLSPAQRVGPLRPLARCTGLALWGPWSPWAEDGGWPVFCRQASVGAATTPAWKGVGLIPLA